MKSNNFCVIGHPLGHTMSPFIHSKLFELSGKGAEYSARDIEPDTLGEAFDELKNLVGFNVTIPFKQQIIPLLDRLDGSAELCGAVNTVCTGDENVGYNTDMGGFEGALKRAGIPLSGKVLLCGAGGAARAVSYCALKAGCELTLAVIDRKQAEELCADISAKFGGYRPEIVGYDEIKESYDLAVNATPVGMYPKTGVSVLTEEQIKRCNAVYDLVYNPRETELIRIARKNGIKCDSGMSMLVIQAAKAHEIWYNAKFTDEQIGEIIDAATKETERIFMGGEK